METDKQLIERIAKECGVSKAWAKRTLKHFRDAEKEVNKNFKSFYFKNLKPR